MRKANRPDKDQVGSSFFNEAGHSGYRALPGRRTLTAAQNKSLLRGELGGIRVLMMMWPGYLIGLQRGV